MTHPRSSTRFPTDDAADFTTAGAMIAAVATFVFFMGGGWIGLGALAVGIVLVIGAAAI